MATQKIKSEISRRAAGKGSGKRESFVTVVSWASESDYLEAKEKADAEGISLANWLLRGRGYEARAVGAPRGNRNNTAGRPKRTPTRSARKSKS